MFVLNSWWCCLFVAVPRTYTKFIILKWNHIRCFGSDVYLLIWQLVFNAIFCLEWKILIQSIVKVFFQKMVWPLEYTLAISLTFKIFSIVSSSFKLFFYSIQTFILSSLGETCYRVYTYVCFIWLRLLSYIEYNILIL